MSRKHTFPIAALLEWYQRNQRALPWRESRDFYRVWLSEVMLQQTQVKTVIPYFQRFLTAFPNLRHLARADEQTVLKQWEGLGYYARCRNFHKAARQVAEQGIPNTAKDFQKLPGVGPYIAAAVYSICYHRPLPAVDANVIRVVCRLWAITEDTSTTACKTRLVERLQQVIPTHDPGAFNQAMMELGALVCLPAAKCDDCPLRTHCRALAKDMVADLPRKAKKRPVPQYRVVVGAIVAQGRLYIQQRPSVGHLGGMWELPGGKVEQGEDPARAVAREISEETGMRVSVRTRVKDVRHAYSHFRILLSVYHCELVQPGAPPLGAQPHRWVTWQELQAYPLPGANKKFLQELKIIMDNTAE